MAEQTAEDPIGLALTEALISLKFGPTTTSSTFVLPVGIYLDTSDENVVREAKRYWTEALTKEGFEVIADHEVSGSKFITIFAKTVNRSYEQFKQQVARLNAHAKKFCEKVQQGAAVVVLLGSSISVVGPAVTPNVPNPAPNAPCQIIQLAPQQSHDVWQRVGREIQHEGTTAEEVVGGILGVIGIIGLHTPKKHLRKKKSGKKH
jgi:hypothetical protein